MADAISNLAFDLSGFRSTGLVEADVGYVLRILG